MTHKILLIGLFLFCLFSCKTNNQKDTSEEIYVIKYKDFSDVDTNDQQSKRHE